jgi:hypothetical protein
LGTSLDQEGSQVKENGMVKKIISVGHLTNRHFEVLRQWVRRHCPIGTDTPFDEVIDRLDRVPDDLPSRKRL